jgi:tetratricopeptide (TPR) repeat protein
MSPENKPAPEPQAWNRWKWIALLGVVILLTGSGAWLLLRHLSASALRAELPELPELSDAPPAMANQIRSADGAARKQVHSADSVGLLGAVYHGNLYYEEAGACYRLAGRLGPGDHRWPYCLALLHETVGRPDQALPLLERAVELSSGAPWVRWRLGNVALKLGRLDMARQAFGELAETDTHRQHGILGLADIARREKRWQDVIDLLSPALADDPGFGPARHMLASAYEALGTPEKAREVLPPYKRAPTALSAHDPDSEAIDQLSCSSTHLLKVATLAQRQEGFGQRQGQLLRRLVEVAPEDLDGHLALCWWNIEAAMSLLQQGATSQSERFLEQALEEARIAVRLGPNSGMAHSHLGIALMKMGDAEQAITHLKRALEIDPNMPPVHRHLAIIYMATERYEDAVQHAEAALCASPRDPEYLHCLAMAVEGLGDSDRAMTLRYEALDVDPEYAPARLDLASELMDQGEYSLAQAHLDVVLKSNPQNAYAQQLASALRERRVVGN